MSTYLRFNQNQVYKQHDKVMFDIFVAEAPTVLAYGKSHSMAGRLVVSAGVFGVKCLHRIPTLDANRHRISASSCELFAFKCCVSFMNCCMRRSGYKCQGSVHSALRFGEAEKIKQTSQTRSLSEVGC